VDQRTPPSWVRQRCVELVALAQGAEANPRDADEKTSLVIAHQPRGSGERVGHVVPPSIVRWSAYAPLEPTPNC